MSQLLTLPTPLPSSSIALGQLITDPTHADALSFSPASTPECREPSVQTEYQSTVIHDEHGRFASSTARVEQIPQAARITVAAEQISHVSIAQPRAAFNILRQTDAAQSFFRKSALQRQPLYHVTGIQTLKNPSYTRAGVEGSIAEAPAAKVRLPTHVRRVDSAFGFDNSTSLEGKTDETIFAVELMKVRCRVGAASEPHGVEDIDYEWSYHQLEADELQLSIGLGQVLKASELEFLAGMTADEDFTDESWDSQSEDEDDGIGGF